MFQLIKMEKRANIDANVKMDLPKQVTINSIGTVAVLFAQWLISVLLVRMGGFADAGIFSLAMSVANVFGAVSNFGLRSYQISDAGKQFEQKHYMLAKFAAIGLSFAALFVYLWVDATYLPRNKWAICLYLVYLSLGFFSDTMLGTLQLRDKLYLSGYSNLLKGICCFGSFVLSYVLWKDLLLSLGLMAAAGIAVSVVYDLRFFARERVDTALQKNDFPEVWGVIKACFPLMVSAILPYISTALPRRILLNSLGETYLGYYSSLFTPTVIITTLVPAVAIGIVPGMARAWVGRNRGQFVRYLILSLLGTLGITLAAFLCAFAVGKPVIRLVFGQEILAYFNLLYVAIAVSGLAAMRSVADSALICMRKTGTVTAFSAVEVVVIAALAGRFVASMGLYGAAYVMLAGYAVHLLLQLAAIALTYKKTFKEDEHE